MSLSSAIEAAVTDIPLVAEIRQDMVVKNLIKAYKASTWAWFSEEDISTELVELTTSVAFDSEALPLSGTRGIKDASKARKMLSANRDRLVALNAALRKGISKTSKVLRVGRVYIRQRDDLAGMTVKHADSISEVALREIVENLETMKVLLDGVKETMTSVDNKAKMLDAWFNLHKQYVFMTANGRGPRGDEETYRASERQSRRIGKRKTKATDED